MKPLETTEDASSDGMENHVARLNCQRNAPVVRKQLRMDWEKELQIFGVGGKSRKSPMLVGGKKPNGKFRLNDAADVGKTTVGEAGPSHRHLLAKNVRISCVLAHDCDRRGGFTRD
jgi:hypothetical protein